ncbi:MAG: hypothetical protein LBU27_05565 [Candidatus Peribacteria bacterium]|nr:hypothetical protein [Candidatus Peribacteria bacterium]
MIANANAQKVEKVGLAEAQVILEQGKSQATAYKLSQEALGPDYARLQIIEAISKNKLPIIPQNILIGGGESGGLITQFLGIEMIEKLTGKPFNPQSSDVPTDSSGQIKQVLEEKREDSSSTGNKKPAQKR